MGHKDISNLIYMAKLKNFHVSKNVLNSYGEYKNAKSELIRKFATDKDVKGNIKIFLDTILPIIFEEDAPRLIKAYDGDYEALFYEITPWINANLLPAMKREARKHKRQYLKFIR